MNKVHPFQITQDLKANRGNPKGACIMVMFRIAHLLRRNRVTFVIFIPYFISYRIGIEWILGVELPWKTKIGPGFRIDHGQSLVVNDSVVFGRNCRVRHCTTVGNRQLADGSLSRSPIIGDNVDIGANAVIIGPITIGDNVNIGAGAVVTKSIPANHVAVGNPARTFSKARII